MNRITSQTSLQAAKVIQDASQFEDVQITVSWSGDVREANALERVIYGVVDFFDAGAPDRRRNEAREAVKAKLTTEVSILVGPPSIVGSAASPNEMTEAINQVTNNLINTGTFTKKNLPSDLGDALQNINKITAETDKKSRKLIWKAAAEQRNENKKVSIYAAKNIAQNTKIWKESLNIRTRDAFRLASNAWKLYESKKILPEEGKEILLCSGRLISRHGFNHEDALNYAIDLRAPLKTLRLGLDSVERVMKSLDYAIPELREQPERLRISAAIRYLQLQDPKHAEVKTIKEIRRSLVDLPRLQQAMPKGCVIDQIHQGAHVRGLSKHSFPEPSPTIDDKKKSLTAPEQALTNGANSLMSADILKSTSEPVHEVQLSKVFENFDRQHVANFSRQQFLNQEEYSVTTSGGDTLAQASFQANRLNSLNPYVDEFSLYATHYANATHLLADPVNSGKSKNDELMQRARIEIPLIANPAPNTKASAGRFSVKRSVQLSLTVPRSPGISASCRVAEVSEEWDLMVNWDGWMSEREKIGAL
jgi:hypothetical protein